MKEINKNQWLSTLAIVVLISFQSSVHTIPDPNLVEQIAKIKAIDNYSLMSPATANQGNEEEPADLLGQPPFDLPVNLRFDNPHWICAWRDLYGYKYNDMERDHLSLLFKEKQRIKRQQGENYTTWVLDKLGIETVLVGWQELGWGQTPPRFYWVPLADDFWHPFSGIHYTSDIKPTATLEEYTKTVVTPAIESFKQDGAIAIKFVVIVYRGSLNFEKVSSVEAASVYEQLLQGKEVSISEQRKLEDYLFRYITQEAGRLDLKVHIYSGIGRDPHFNISGSNPMLLESVFNDPDQRNTKFVIIHGGWPFDKEAGAMLCKPNVYIDFSGQAWFRSTRALSKTIRAWLEWYPEKVLFGTKALGISPLLDWEERAWLSTKTARNALAIALTEMMNDGQISRERAFELAEMVLRTNAIRLYGFKPYVVLERGDVRAVIVNNEPVDDEVLPGHRGGYSGVASLTHRSREKNLFVPLYAGLNFEHIHDGTSQPRDILFEPRRAQMQIKQIDEYTAELYQLPTPHWQLESWLRYQLLDDGTIEMSLECIPRARTFKNDYIGLFFASYIDKPESLDIHFLGRPADDSNVKPQWIRGVTPEHGVLSTHLATDDNRNFTHDPNFPLTLVFNRSNYRYTKPWYYGVSHGMAFVLMFRSCDNVRLSQSPSGGGEGNPAWDFQWFIPQYKVGQKYQFIMRAMYLPFKSQQQIITVTSRHRAALE